MKPLDRSLLVLAAGMAFSQIASAVTETFDNLEPGPLPPSWETKFTGPVAFRIVTIDDPGKHNALKIHHPGKGYAWAIKSDVRIRDGFVEVQGKTMPYEVRRPDRLTDPYNCSIGVIWRYQDPSNYYFVGAAGDKMHFYKMINGVRSRVQNSAAIFPHTGEWHKVRVEFTGYTIKVFLNDRELYTAADFGDPGLGGEILKAGAVGVWTESPRTTYFDNFSYGEFVSVGYDDFEDMYPLPPSGARGGARHTEEDFAKIGSVGPIKPPWKFGSTRDAVRVYPKGRPMWEVIEYRGGFSTDHSFATNTWTQTVISHVLRQSGWGAHLWCVNTDTNIRDGYVEVLGKFTSGESIARHIGVIWRYQDEKNYYWARANAIEDSVVVFRIIDGLRSRALGRSRLIHMPADVWNLLRVEFVGNQFKVMWNGQTLYTVTDDNITQPGAVGLATKADSISLYDNFSYGGYGGSGGLKASANPMPVIQPVGEYPVPQF